MAKRKPEHFVSHPLFGEIPMIERALTDADGRPLVDSIGRPVVVREYDPGYQPPLPKGAVRGDIRKQNYCPMCLVPRYFYVDEPRRCVQCDRDFVFGANEQKHWFETLGFYLRARAVRCLECRRQRHSGRAIRTRLCEAKRLAVEHPDDPAALLDAVAATLEYRTRFGEGDIDEAIGWARSVGERNPAMVEAMYWEAECQLAAGRRSKASARFQSFIAAAGTKAPLRNLVRKACKRLEAV